MWKTAVHTICGKLHSIKFVENCILQNVWKTASTKFVKNCISQNLGIMCDFFLISAPNLSPSTFLRLMHVRNCSTSFWLSWHLKAWNTASAFGNFLIFYLDQGKYYHATSGILKNNWSSKNWFLCEFCYKLN